MEESYLLEILSIEHRSPAKYTKKNAFKFQEELTTANSRNSLNDRISRCFEKLNKIIRMVDGLPLAVTSVHPVDPVFRGTEPCLPLPYRGECKSCFNKTDFLIPKPTNAFAVPWCPGLLVNITLETSGKWPHDLAAIYRLKAAFYLKLAELIRSQFDVTASACPKYLDVFLALFKPVTKDFDVIIRLHKRCLPRAYQGLHSSFETTDGLQYHRKHSKSEQSIAATNNKRIPVTNFDPAVEYLSDLKDTYGHVALFFHGACGGDIIGVVWRPSALSVTKCSLSRVNGRKLRKRKNVNQQTGETKSQVVLVMDKKLVREDFEIIGKGLVRSIEDTSTNATT